MELLKQLFQLNGTQSITEEGEEESEFPKVIAKADEFRVELDEDEQVHLLDGEDTVRVSMPYVIWKQLTR